MAEETKEEETTMIGFPEGPYTDMSVKEVAMACTVQIKCSAIETDHFTIAEVDQPNKEQTATGSGSIVVLNKNTCLVLTNKHVASALRNYVCMEQLFGEDVWFESQTVRCVPSKDLAIIKLVHKEDIAKFIKAGAKAVQLVAPFTERRGQHICNAGHSLGRSATGFDNTCTIKSFQDMSHLNECPPTGRAHVAEGVFDINPGNSGGPFFNEYGQQVLICNATNPSANEVNFAIPMSTLYSVTPQLFQDLTEEEKALESDHVHVLDMPRFPFHAEKGTINKEWKEVNGYPVDMTGILVNAVHFEYNMWNELKELHHFLMPGDMIISARFRNFAQTFPRELMSIPDTRSKDLQVVMVEFGDDGSIKPRGKDKPKFKGMATPLRTFYHMFDSMPLGWRYQLEILRKRSDGNVSRMWLPARPHARPPAAKIHAFPFIYPNYRKIVKTPEGFVACPRSTFRAGMFFQETTENMLQLANPGAFIMGTDSMGSEPAVYLYAVMQGSYLDEVVFANITPIAVGEDYYCLAGLLRFNGEKVDSIQHFEDMYDDADEDDILRFDFDGQKEPIFVRKTKK